ncbi:hypothetical protein [Streptomyces chartreusis]|uniref:Uncharacterized protein n=1 Tax=Streptomyces chartreusis TaxID=1969 RepID=A0A7H8TA43_STRCX|nr:hypothetical protein [Streptomyces chartreusis]QKZ20383.1 hypothetical protein HUT05_25350 [Streptomyces chartreusis]
MLARIRKRLQGQQPRPHIHRWKVTKYLYVEACSLDRSVTLERRPNPKCSVCEGDGYLTEFINWTDEYAGDCPTCPQPRRLALMVYGPPQPTNYHNDPPF